MVGGVEKGKENSGNSSDNTSYNENIFGNKNVVDEARVDSTEDDRDKHRG